MIYRCDICGATCDVTFDSVYCPYCRYEHGAPEDCEELKEYESEEEEAYECSYTAEAWEELEREKKARGQGRGLKPGDFIASYNKVADRGRKRRESHWADLILADKKAPFTLGVAFLIKDRERARRMWEPAVRYQRRNPR